MKEIKCPNCGKAITIDESGYAEILKQVRNEEFEKELENSREQTEREIKFKVGQAENAVRAEYEKRLHQKELEIKEKENEFSREKTSIERGYDEELKKKDREIIENQKQISLLEVRIEEGKKDVAIAVNDAVSQKKDEIAQKEREISALKNTIAIKDRERQIAEKQMTEDFDRKLKDKEEEINYYKDYKSRLSVKLLGESLEQHCENEFNKMRALGFNGAYFEKDNDARTGSKGDYIFRDFDDEGGELLSIMFEMKNESDTGSAKKKNEDFFKELDKDRKEKNCEYAILVSLLEPNNEFYNGGIVDVSYRYPKMYVIRPQFFIPIITILRNAALKSVDYKKQLTIAKNQSLDVNNFERNLNEFKDRFAKNCRLAGERFRTAVEEIDKSIDHLQKIKEALTGSENNLRLANNKLEDLTIKKLTKNSPSVAKMFESACNNADTDNDNEY